MRAMSQANKYMPKKNALFSNLEDFECITLIKNHYDLLVLHRFFY